MKKVFILIAASIIIVLMTSFGRKDINKKDHLSSFHSTKAVYPLPNQYNDLFAGSGACETCHGATGTAPNTSANANINGDDVSVVSYWRSTMMANAAKDPFWRAKVSHEGIMNPTHKDLTEDICTKCHAPGGNVNAHHNGTSYYSIAMMENDAIGLDGVNCTGCHSIRPDGLGSVFSANMEYDTNQTIFGPYQNVFGQPMINMSGFTPTYGSHIHSSELCGSCHTLITNTFDSNGNLTNHTFVEQAVYHEWKNSIYSSTNTECGDCHEPRINDPITISNRPPWLGSQSPFGLHEFAGGNVFMQKLLKNYIDSLQLGAQPAHFDSTIARTYRMLQNKSLDLKVFDLGVQNDSLIVSVSLSNITGHKFPSGYPSRRSFIEVIATNENSETIFHSGAYDQDGYIIHEPLDYERHHQQIVDDQQTQIYELVMGDLDTNVTTILERAFIPIKDNRIPPKGFTTTHHSYDTVKIAGLAIQDTDFNITNNVQGSGSDSVIYKIDLNQYNGAVNVAVNVFYQSIPPKWLNEMFQHSSPEINRFKSWYQQADHTPILVATKQLTLSTSLFDFEETQIKVYPNPSKGKINIVSDSPIENILLYDHNGRQYINEKTSSLRNIELNLPSASGTYYLQMEIEGKKIIRKVVRL